MSETQNLLTKLIGNPVFLGTCGAIIIGLIGTMLLSIVFYLTPLSEAYLQPSGTTLYLAGAFSGGLIAARKAGGKAILYGSEVGIIYFFFFTVVTLLIAPGSFAMLALILKGVYTLMVSVAGGVIGIAFTD